MNDRPRPCRLDLIAALAAVFVSMPALGSDAISQDQRQFFESKIRPVLVKHCYECHSHEADLISADYALDSAEGLLSGGASGEAAVVPGEPESSRLLRALEYAEDGLQMPPGGKLPEGVIGDFERWIAMGAPDPRSDDSETLKREAHRKAAKSLWSFRSPVDPAVPDVRNEGWPVTAVDRFVLAKLEENGLSPVGDAEPEKLLRRVYFDLVGLPPGPGEVERFVAEPTPAALADVVDRLLKSPRFGERWGRHWLDLARYAESSGMEFNFTYPHAWPYRNYVIDSFNEDKPYDRFVTEQLAGDLLPADSPRERGENRLATGFLSIGPKRHNAGTRSFRADVVDDQIRATSEAFLGLTVGCARCHDHKFDPIPSEDYYALAGIFSSTQTLHGTTKIKYSRHPSGLVPFGPAAQQRHEAYEAHRKKVDSAEKELANAESEQQESEKKLKAEREKLAKIDEKLSDAEKKQDEPDEALAEEKQTKIEEIETLEQTVASQRETAVSLKKTVKQLKANAPDPPKYAMGATEGKIDDAAVAIGGDPGNRGETVPRGFLSRVEVEDAAEVNEDASGRLALARWITSSENPLTARVMVNRVWHHLFGRGLVSSVNNFGVLGEPPTHPRLLDHLAVRFMDDGWSVKKLIRRLVLSRVYRLSTRKDPEHFRQDPDNRWRWRMTPRRLEVEPLRDAILAVSGGLDLSRPDGSSVTSLGQQLARGVSWDKLNPDSRRRTVYLPVVRHYAPHMLQEFDFAASSLVVGDRAETTTSQQALFFLNSDFVFEAARDTARLLMRRHPGETRRQIDRAYRRAFSRHASADELAVAAKFLKRVSAVLEQEQPDAAAAGLHERALASLIQALFGSAEFRYLIHAPDVEAARVAAR